MDSPDSKSEFKLGRKLKTGARAVVTLTSFLGPALSVMGIVILYPIVEGARLSLFSYKLTRPSDVGFSWFDNYNYMISDAVFWEAMQNTFVFTGCVVGISCLVGLIMALLLQRPLIIFKFLRGIVLIPWVIPGIVIGYLFLYMFDFEIGIINNMLVQSGLIRKALPWLADRELAMVAIIIAHVWNQTPFFLLMFTAGLMSIPEEALEAAYLEGSSSWQEFRYVVFAYLKKIMVIATLLMVIRNFNNFPVIYAMTGGGPSFSTTTAVIYIYRVAFERFDIGYASAIGTIWVLILLTLSIIYTRFLKDEF
ncbi:MAG: ABC transporter permease [Spirochaetes bacterium RIFOXYC1_FULL_54_7]|nr:MAG: ABC transporter permease [Spirochaetes bacterium RIFOXYC1_FULL_54_7]